MKMHEKRGDEGFLVPTKDGNYRNSKTGEKIKYTKRLGELLETEKMKKHQHEDGSYPLKSLTEEIREEIRKQNKTA